MALLAALALVVGAAGCGSTSSSSTGETGGTSTASQAVTTAGAAGGASGSGTAENGNSIEGYGSEATGASKREIIRATHSFLTAMATRRYGAICTGLAAANQRQLAQFAELKQDGAKGCAEGVSQLLARGAAEEARKAARAPIDKVRIKGGTAFVVFRARGGVPNYFVVKKEAGAWKAISLSTGTPLSPTLKP